MDDSDLKSESKNTNPKKWGKTAIAFLSGGTDAIAPKIFMLLGPCVA
jgi:hypothetical protein